MSIYCTTTDVGGKWANEDTLPGAVLAYLGSHVYPSRDHEAGAIDLAYIPVHCTSPEGEWEPWLRLALGGAGDDGLDVVLDRKAVESLRAMLTDYLDSIDEIESDVVIWP